MKKKSLFFLLPLLLVGCGEALPTETGSAVSAESMDPIESISYSPIGGYQKYSFLYNNSETPDGYELVFKEGDGRYYPNTIVEFSIHFTDETKVPFLILFQNIEVIYQESYTITMPWTPFFIDIYFTDADPVLDKTLPSEEKSVSLGDYDHRNIGDMDSTERRYPIYDKEDNIVYTLTPGDVVREYIEGGEVKFGILTPAKECKGKLAKVTDEIYLFVPNEEENLFYFAQPHTLIEIGDHFYTIQYALSQDMFTIDQEVTALYNELETNEYGFYNISAITMNEDKQLPS